MSGKTEEQVIAERHGYTKGSSVFDLFVKGDVHVWFGIGGWYRTPPTGVLPIGLYRRYKTLEDALSGNDDPTTYTLVTT